MKVLGKSLKVWFPLAITTTLICGLIYVVAQQSYRISANDPQIQIAQDVAGEILNGQNPVAFIPTHKIELSKSLATFIMIFDKDGKLLGSSVMVDGKIPELPSGVFTDTKNSKDQEKRFTWQPRTGVRSALVVDYYAGKNPGFVAVGRSLYEVEKRIDNLTTIVFVGWLITLVSTLFYTGFGQKTR